MTCIRRKFVCFLFAVLGPFLIWAPVSAQQPSDTDFLQAINSGGPGDDFPDAVSIPNRCDFRSCSDRECRLGILTETIAGQEKEYLAKKYGRQGVDWEIIGEDNINIDDRGVSRYYDDLGIKITGTGEEKVLHFDITFSVIALNRAGRY